MTVDLGRPDRFWHLIPGIGQLNFPASMLSWDVIVLNGYLLLNVHICGYLLYCRYQGKKPSKWFYIPFVFVAIGWAVSIHTVTAFLYVGLGGRPFWNSAIVGPRFIASAFTAGPAMIILALQVVRRVTASAPAPALGSIGRAAAPGTSSSRPATLDDLEKLAQHLPEFRPVPIEDAPETPHQHDRPLRSGWRDVAAPGRPRCSRLFRFGGRDRRQTRGERTPPDHPHHPSRWPVWPGLALNLTPRMATAIAEEAALVLRVPVEDLRRLMQQRELGQVIHNRMTERLMITDRALLTLRSIVQVSMLINVFLLVNKVFKEFYSGDLHVASSKYLFLGLDGYHALVPWIWTAVAFNLVAMFLLVLPLSRSLKWLNLTCVLCIIGIWIEKGMGLVIPGLIPTPLGQIVEYRPWLNETLVCIGIWAFGLLAFTVFLRMSVPILQGRLSRANEGRPLPATASARS